MDKVLGALAGIGMLFLIGALVFRFLRELGWSMRRETVKRLLRITGMTLGVGAAYWLLGALIRLTLYGTLDNGAEGIEVFYGPYVRAMFDALQNPCWIGPLSGLFAYIGHGVGEVLMGGYALGGVILAFLLTDGAICLLDARFRALWGSEHAEKAVFLLLCLPGAVFLFLPGWAPMLLLGVAALFYLLGRWLPQGKPAYPPAAHDALLCLCALLSALVTACAVLGRIG